MRRTSGISLLLLIFLSLCLIIFSLLSLSGAVADETLSTQAADRTVAYYAAVTKANDMLSRIDAQLASYLRESEEAEDPATNASPSEDDRGSRPAAAEKDVASKADAYLQLCSRIGDAIPDASWEDGTISFSVDVDEDQILQARLGISYPASDDDPLYEILAWKIVNVSDWTADNSMHLFRTDDLTH